MVQYVNVYIDIFRFSWVRYQWYERQFDILLYHRKNYKTHDTKIFLSIFGRCISNINMNNIHANLFKSHEIFTLMIVFGLKCYSVPKFCSLFHFSP